MKVLRRGVMRLLLHRPIFDHPVDGLIWFWGGLGNQMFQYAFYRSLRTLHPTRRILADLTPFESYALHNGFELEEIFGLRLEQPSPSDAKRFRRWSRRLGLVEKEDFSAGSPLDLQAIAYPAYLKGYWQSSRYFEPIRDLLLAEFTFPALTRTLHDCGLGAGEVPCSIHVRRGDYLRPENRAFGGICTDAYYEAAIAAVRSRVPNARFFVFSNDPEWCRGQYSSREFTVIDSRGRPNWEDLCLMSRCEWNVVANSTFSWWAAWLKARPPDPRSARTVLCPRLFMQTDHAEELGNSFYPPEWLRIDALGARIGW